MSPLGSRGWVSSSPETTKGSLTPTWPRTRTQQRVPVPPQESTAFGFWIIGFVHHLLARFLQCNWFNQMFKQNQNRFNKERYWYWVICRDVDGPRDSHTEWSKSEREKKILYINACMWNLEKLYRWTYLQGRNRDTEVVDGQMDTGVDKGGWDELGD